MLNHTKPFTSTTPVKTKYPNSYTRTSPRNPDRTFLFVESVYCSQDKTVSSILLDSRIGVL